MAVVYGLKAAACLVKDPSFTLNYPSKPGSLKRSRKWKNNMARPKFLECIICGKQQPYRPFEAAICEHCSSQWLEGRYDYENFKREVLRGLPGRPLNLWRYQDVLPLDNPASLDLYPAGGTPL